MKKLLMYAVVPWLIVGTLSCSEQEEPTQLEEDGYALVWSDEFDGSGAINADNWFHQTQLPNGDSWYNGELQHYTDRTDNSYVQDGFMHIVAKRESFSDQDR
jgi:hypothetical protein